MSRQWVPIGVIARPHGLRGELRVRLFNPESDVLLGCKRIQLAEAEETVRSARRERDSVLLRLEGCESREQAERLRGAEVAVLRSDLPATEPGEYYLHDLVGLRAIDPQGHTIGIVVEVVETPAHATLLLQRDGGTLEVPLAEPFVKSVDLEAGQIWLHGIEELSGRQGQ